MQVVTLSANRPSVLDEVFDGEAVLVNLATGRYYALSPLATEYWSVLSPGADWPGALAAIVAVSGADRSTIEATALRFVHRLVDEGLLLASAPLPPAAPADPHTDADGPTLQVFNDMEDLLMLDPIHDIDLDGSGWPQAPAQPA